MRRTKWLALIAAGMFVIPGGAAFADRKDHGDHHGNGHWRDKHGDGDDDEDRRGYGFGERDRDDIRGWYAVHYRHLPPGLAKKYWLPPPQERLLVIHAAFPVELERQVYAVPPDLDRELPPPPPDCERVAIGGHIVLRNRNTRVVLDIFHFE